MSPTRSLDTDHLGRLLAKLSLPAIAGMLMLGLYNLVDAVFVGRAVGTLGIAGIAVVSPLQIAQLAIGLTLGTGSASIVSRALGAGNPRRAEAAFGNMTAAAVALSAVVMALGYGLLDPLLRLCGATQAILPYARDYQVVILAGTLFHVYSIAGNNIIRAEGKARAAMISMTLGAGLNIVLDAIFILGMGMGMTGAALATVIAQAVSAVYIVLHFLSPRSSLSLAPRGLKPIWRLQREIHAIGASSFARQITGGVLAVIINRTLGALGGDLQVAVFGVAHRLLLLAVMPLIGISQGLQPIVGYNFGARRLDRARHAVGLAALWGTIIGVAVMLALVLLPSFFVRAFTKDAALIREGGAALRLISLRLPLLGVQMISVTVCQAQGRARAAMALTLARQLSFQLAFVLILPRLIGIPGVWLAFPLSDLLSAALSASLLLRLMRRFKSQAEALAAPSRAEGAAARPITP